GLDRRPRGRQVRRRNRRAGRRRRRRCRIRPHHARRRNEQQPSITMPRISAFFSYGSAKARNAWSWGLAHKAWGAVIVVAVLGGGYFAYAHYFKSASATQYMLASASRENIIVTVSGSGQVAANQEISVTPKQSGTVTWVGVKAGDQVSAGEVIARIDDTDAEKSLRDAQTSLLSAQISYKQALASADSSNTKA